MDKYKLFGLGLCLDEQKNFLFVQLFRFLHHRKFHFQPLKHFKKNLYLQV